MRLPTQYFFSFSFLLQKFLCFTLQFLVLSFTVNSATTYAERKREEVMLWVSLRCVLDEKNESFSFSVTLPPVFFLLLNFKPTNRLLIDSKKRDLHSNWSGFVQQHLHAVEKKTKLYDPLFYSSNLIYHNKTTMMPTIDTEQGTNISPHTSHRSLSY